MLGRDATPALKKSLNNWGGGGGGGGTTLFFHPQKFVSVSRHEVGVSSHIPNLSDKDFIFWIQRGVFEPPPPPNTPFIHT